LRVISSSLKISSSIEGVPEDFREWDAIMLSVVRWLLRNVGKVERLFKRQVCE